jgi:hypothetical protein
MSTKLKAGALVVVLLGIAALLLVQQHEIRRLLAENAALQTQLDQLAALRDSHGQLAEQLKAALETAQADRNELMRLRGQGVRLRQLEQENTQLKAQGQQLAQQMRERQSVAAAATSPTETPPTALQVTTKTTSAPPANQTDLGLIEFSDGLAIRFDLGGGTNCLVTPKALSDGNATMEITMGIANADGTVSELGTSRITARPGQHCSVSVGDRMIALAVKLK